MFRQTCHLAGHGPPDPDNPKMLRGGGYTERSEVCFRCHLRENYRNRDIHAEVREFEGCEFCHIVKERTALRPGSSTAPRCSAIQPARIRSHLKSRLRPGCSKSCKARAVRPSGSIFRKIRC